MSPYENRLNSENFRRVALIAEVSRESESALEAMLLNKPAELDAATTAAGIRHLHLYLQRFDARSVLFIYFEMDELDQEQAIWVLKQSASWWAELELLLETPWHRAEFINVVANNTVREREIGQAQGLAAGLHREKECDYRTLHQTNWPGVIDQMRRSHYQNWTTFMLEFDRDLLLFTHVEYLGRDPAADEQRMQTDSVTQRWWAHTEPCLYPLVEGSVNWESMRAF